MKRKHRFEAEDLYEDDYAKEDYADEDEPVELGDVLEPYDEAPEDGHYENYDESAYQELYDGYDESDDAEEDPEGRFKVAMSVLNVASILLGVVAILVLSALLISLFSWLSSDIQHSMVLLQSNLQ